MPQSGKPEFSDEEIADAVASIFKQMVMVDGVVRPEEISSATRSLVGGYGYLDANDPEKSITEKFSNAKHETAYSIAAVLNKALTKAQRKQLKHELMATAMSDQEFHPYEQEYMELVDRLIKG